MKFEKIIISSINIEKWNRAHTYDRKKIPWLFPDFFLINSQNAHFITDPKLTYLQKLV